MKTLIIFLFLSYSVSAGQFTTRSPDGASYDVRTHYFNEAQGRVLVRQEFEGMSDADRCSLVGLKHVDNNGLITIIIVTIIIVIITTVGTNESYSCLTLC